MPLFKKDAQERGPGDPAQAPGLDVLAGPEIRERLATELWRASRFGRPVSLLTATPGLLAGERIWREEVQFAEAAIARLLRRSDSVGRLGEAGFLIVLPETDLDAAVAVAHRLQAELGLRSGAINRRDWRVGSASYPMHGEGGDELITASLAIGEGPRHRRRAA